jgi:hypothetical protein
VPSMRIVVIVGEAVVLPIDAIIVIVVGCCLGNGVQGVISYRCRGIEEDRFCSSSRKCRTMQGTRIKKCGHVMHLETHIRKEFCNLPRMDCKVLRN